MSMTTLLREAAQQKLLRPLDVQLPLLWPPKMSPP